MRRTHLIHTAQPRPARERRRARMVRRAARSRANLAFQNELIQLRDEIAQHAAEERAEIEREYAVLTRDIEETYGRKPFWPWSKRK